MEKEESITDEQSRNLPRYIRADCCRPEVLRDCPMQMVDIVAAVPRTLVTVRLWRNPLARVQEAVLATQQAQRI